MGKWLFWLGLISMVLFISGMPIQGIDLAHEHPEGDYFAVLTGAEAIPPRETPASGHVTFWFSEDNSSLFFRVEVYDITDVLMVNLRRGEPDRGGSVMAWLFPEAPPPTPIRHPGRFSGILAERSITDDDLVGHFAGKTIRDVREEMEQGRTFVQVDTVLRQMGEIRGQVQPVWAGWDDHYEPER